jgi:hypothetical protein
MSFSTLTTNPSAVPDPRSFGFTGTLVHLPSGETRLMDHPSLHGNIANTVMRGYAGRGSGFGFVRTHPYQRPLNERKYLMRPGDGSTAISSLAAFIDDGSDQEKEATVKSMIESAKSPPVSLMEHPLIRQFMNNYAGRNASFEQLLLAREHWWIAYVIRYILSVDLTGGETNRNIFCIPSSALGKSDTIKLLGKETYRQLIEHAPLGYVLGVASLDVIISSAGHDTKLYDIIRNHIPPVLDDVPTEEFLHTIERQRYHTSFNRGKFIRDIQNHIMTSPRYQKNDPSDNFHFSPKRLFITSFDDDDNDSMDASGVSNAEVAPTSTTESVESSSSSSSSSSTVLPFTASDPVSGWLVKLESALKAKHVQEPWLSMIVERLRNDRVRQHHSSFITFEYLVKYFSSTSHGDIAVIVDVIQSLSKEQIGWSPTPRT